MQEELRSEVSVNTMVQKLRCRPLLARVLAAEHLAEDPAFRDPTEKPAPDQAVLLSRLEGMVTTSLRRLTRLVDINVTSRSPELSARIANGIAREFSGLDQIAQSALTRNASTYLDQEAERLKVKVEAEERALQELREQAGSIGVQNSQTYFLPKLQEANVRLGQSRAEASRLQACYEQAVSLTNRIEELLNLPLVAREPALNQSRQRLAQVEAEFAACQLRYKARHPKYQQAMRQVEEARTTLHREALKLPGSYHLARNAALTTASNVAAEVKETEAEALRLSAKEVEFKMLSRQVDSDRAMLAAVLNRLAETVVTTDLRAEKLRLIEPAVSPRAPCSPRRALILAAGVLVGLVAGLAIVLGLQTMDRSIQSAEQAEADLGLPVINVIPKLRAAPNAAPRLVTDDQMHPVGAEAFRTLRTALAMLGPAQDRRSVLFTSTAPEEGKTFTSINYAATLAQQGLRTLVVDADLRRPSVEEYLAGAGEPRPGLTDYLSGRSSLADIAYPLGGYPNLHWVPAGQPVPNPAELLVQDCLRGFLAEALQRFERVVVDTAPVTAVSDTLAIAASCEATVLVIRSRFTPRRHILRVVQMLQQAGAKLCGVVVNQEPRHRGLPYYAYSKPTVGSRYPSQSRPSPARSATSRGA